MDDSPLATLPRELRDYIWEFALHQPQGIVTEHFICYHGKAWDLRRDYVAGRKHIANWTPPDLPGLPRVSRFKKDRKEDNYDPMTLLRTCKQIRREGLPLFYAANDVVIPVWDMHTKKTGLHVPRYEISFPVLGEDLLPPIRDLLRRWHQHKVDRPRSIVFELQEATGYNAMPGLLLEILQYYTLWPEYYSTVPLHVSIPMPDRLDGNHHFLSAAEQGEQWTPPCRALIDIRKGRLSLKAAKAALLKRCQPWLANPLIQGECMMKAHFELTTGWPALFPP
ncbi:hypothetical protein LTR09_005340 [Extremus antarcticus]|uniref:2EXR domain-containing protein n=1 Tax=Extremus antarcticus TaxID=702011 RepID=A0AAJ0DNI4_9PEZI|nr:hypothetical protein LTR09_005340 [Extremus antarcticus]